MKTFLRMYNIPTKCLILCLAQLSLLAQSNETQIENITKFGEKYAILKLNKPVPVGYININNTQQNPIRAHNKFIIAPGEVFVDGENYVYIVSENKQSETQKFLIKSILLKEDTRTIILFKQIGKNVNIEIKSYSAIGELFILCIKNCFVDGEIFKVLKPNIEQTTFSITTTDNEIILALILNINNEYFYRELNITLEKIETEKIVTERNALSKKIRVFTGAGIVNYNDDTIKSAEKFLIGADYHFYKPFFAGIVYEHNKGNYDKISHMDSENESIGINSVVLKTGLATEHGIFELSGGVRFSYLDSNKFKGNGYGIGGFIELETKLSENSSIFLGISYDDFNDITIKNAHHKRKKLDDANEIYIGWTIKF